MKTNNPELYPIAVNTSLPIPDLEDLMFHVDLVSGDVAVNPKGLDLYLRHVFNMNPMVKERYMGSAQELLILED